MPSPALSLATVVRLARALMRPQLAAFLPAILLAGYWYGGEGVLILFCVLVPLLLLMVGLFDRQAIVLETDPLTGLGTRGRLIAATDRAFADASAETNAVVLALEIDDAEDLRAHLGSGGIETVLRRVADRLDGAVRGHDVVSRLDGHRFGILLLPTRGSGMDVAMSASSRFQAAVAEPISIDAASVYASASVGFCLARRAPERSGAKMLEAAELALTEARRLGAGSVRAYSTAMGEVQKVRSGLAANLDRAFDAGEIRPWFQPQVSTETGEVTGFEALARWHHPERGVIPPGEFLSSIEAAGQLERLGETVLFYGLTALRDWQRAGFRIAHLGVNFSGPELRDPRLVERLGWELDRFDLTPDRLAIEILETVVSRDGEDMVTANVAKLAALGCTIDLDDFGTGHASISNIRRFAVSRIKIDRAFVRNCDNDPTQHKMVAAILSLAAQLDLETIAEGVETPAEHARLSELGCTHVQGYGIARPMPYEDTLPWLQTQASRLAETRAFGGRLGG